MKERKAPKLKIVSNFWFDFANNLSQSINNLSRDLQFNF